MTTVAVVIPNWNGAQHLGPCLDSVRELDYPRDRLDVIVVDNGSTDGSRALVEADYPEVRLLALDQNVGFAAASNRGARIAESECVAFLNNDMRVEPGWLRALVESYDPDDGYVCVAGVILDWEGARIGFTRGWVSYLGHAGQDHYLEPLEEGLIEDGSDLLFACGGSMLIGRDVFLELGGFDPSYFALFEDVDLGWRLWLSGYKVRLAGGSRVLHRHHATASTLPLHRLAVLYERNALATLVKNVDDGNLAPILATALFMLARRAVVSSRSPRESFDLGAADDAETETVDRQGLAPLHAVSDLLDELPDLLERRREVQSRRRRADREIFALFNRPFVPLSRDELSLEAGLNLRSAFGLDRLFPAQRVTRALVVADGEASRLDGIAQSVSALTSTSVVRPGGGADVLDELLAESDLVVVPAATEHAPAVAHGARGLVAVDLGDGARPAAAELVRRADVFLASGPDVETPIADRELLVVANPLEEEAAAVIRRLVQEPWTWRRAEASQTVAVPEDLQELLRSWREQYRRGGRVRRGARAAWRRIPAPMERPLRRLLRRPRLT